MIVLTSPPVLLISGMGCTADLWAEQRTALEAMGVVTDLVVPDADTVDAMAAAVLARQAGPLVLAGHSLGGIVAMAAARRDPHRIAGLALLSTNPRPPRPDQRRSWAEWSRRTRDGDYHDLVERTLLPLLVRPSRLADHELVARIAAMAEETGPMSFLRQLAAQQTRIDERPALRTLRCPSLVVAAESDALCSVATHEELAGLLPDAALEIVPDCGHLSPLESPATVTAVLTRWVADVAAPATVPATP